MRVLLEKPGRCANTPGVEPGISRPDQQVTRRCAVEGCDQPHRAKGYCNAHWHQIRRYGEIVPREPYIGPVFTGEPRFDSKVKISESSFHNGTPCWEWQASLITGYGRFRTGEGTMAAHRWAYIQIVGPVPDELVMDHLCRNKACVNPAHLEPVTNFENISRAPTFWGSRTHCLHGHEFTPDNTIIESKPNGKSRRRCRTCKMAREAKGRDIHREARNAKARAKYHAEKRPGASANERERPQKESPDSPKSKTKESVGRGE